jgi:hypothetical protein
MDIQYSNGPCGTCPVQAEGTINGYPFYFRSRHARWSLHVAATKESDPLDDGAWAIAEDYPVKEAKEEARRVSAGYATKDECIAFIERHAEIFTKTLL